MNLFSLAYKTSYQDNLIKGTTFYHRDESTTYKSPLNTYNWGGKGARAVLAKPIAEAIVSLFNDTILGIGVTSNGRLYIECTDMDDPSKLYQILFESNFIQIYSNANIDTSVSVSPYTFIPILCNDIYQKTNSEFLVLLKGLREIYKRKGLPFDRNDPDTEKYFFLVHDYFYFEHKGTDYMVIVDKIVGIQLQEDLTWDILEKDSDFKMINVKTTKKRTAKQNTVKDTTQIVSKIEIPAIRFDEPLTPDMEERIPNLPDWMQIPAKLIPVEKSVATGRVISVLLHGPAGSGKTTNVKLMCRDIKLPLMAVVNCTINLDEFILGKFIPKGNEFVFYKSEVTEAIEKGGAVVFEEINFGRPEHLAFLNSLLDDNGFVRLDNGEVIKRHPCFRFFATMNYGYAGTNELNKALYNRFQVKVKIEDLTDDQIKNLLLKQSNISPTIADNLIVIYRKIQTKIRQEMREEVISPRDILNWAMQIEDSDPITAAEYTVVAIAEDDDEFAEEIRDIIKMKF